VLLALDSRVVLELPIESRLSQMIHRGDFELDEQCFVRTFLRAGDIVVDVGANLGLFTALAAFTVGAAGRVYAFEPNPERLRSLNRNVARNGLTNVVSSGVALSDQQGRAGFNVVLDGWDAYSSLGAAEPGRSTRRVSVEVDTLDDVCDKAGIGLDRLRLVKIDVEGWEEFVLRGARRTLAGPAAPVIIFEANESAARRSGSSAEAVADVLRSYGYGLWTFSRIRREPVPYPPALTGWSGNLYAIKDVRMVESRLGAPMTWRLRRPGFGLW
jgi:FkbM family methyltransferase